MSSAKSLPDELKDLFRDAFPELDLDRVRVHDRLPWIARLAPVSVRAMVLGRDIYIDRGYDPTSLDDLVTIGHELVHVSQWCRTDHPLARALEAIGFAASYVGQYAANRLRGMRKVEAYRAIRFEREARRFERAIRDVLSERAGRSRSGTPA